MWRSVILLSLSSLPALGGAIELPGLNTIVNGETVRGGDPVARHTVSLSGGCSGTLVAEDIVVSAGHCFRNGARAAAGSIEFGSEPGSAGERRVVGVKVHPGFEDGGNDIALLRFSGGLPRGFAPAPLSSSPPRAGQGVIVAGYGATRSGGGGPPLLRKLRRSVESTKGSEMRLHGSNGSACNGDSGGPGYLESGGRLILAGVVSRSGSGRNCAGAEIHTRVDAHRAWIERASNELRGKGGGESAPPERRPPPRRPDPRDEPEEDMPEDEDYPEDHGRDPDEEEEEDLNNGEGRGEDD